MKLSFSNIALDSFDHINDLYTLNDIGFQGLEVAPSKVWVNVKNVSFQDVQKYKKEVKSSGLEIIGLHSLFWDQPDLGLFIDKYTRKNTLDFLVHLSKICSDLGGYFLVFGSPQARRRNGLTVKDADLITIDFFSELSVEVENHGTCFVIEALGEDESDYINSLEHAMRITEQVSRKEFQSHVDAKAVFNAKESNYSVFKRIKKTLKHCHVNDPGLGILGETGYVNHELFSSLLKKIEYNGYVTAEQRMVDKNDLIGPLKKSISLMKNFYL
tara:strand:- start:173 stop:985 length:813 start_codon:yes stop_codon:yes gene_type:complete